MATHPATSLGLVLGIVAIGCALRFYRLGAWSFWGDEIFTVSGLEDGFNYSAFRASISQGLIRSLVSVAGVSEWSARLVPALFGVLTIPVTYVSVRVLFDRSAALLVALLTAISPWHLYWSQNARFYTALLLFFWLALVFFYAGFERDRPLFLVLSLAFFGVAAKERLLALYFLPIAVLYLLLVHVLSRNRPAGLTRRNLVLFWLPCALAGFLFARPYVADLPAWLEGFGYANNTPVELLGGFGNYVGIPVLTLGAASAAILIHRRNRAALLLALASFLPIVTLVALAPFHYTANRYAFVSLISWITLAAAGVSYFWRQVGGDSRFLVLAIVAVLIGQSVADDALYFYVQGGNRSDWRAALAAVDKERQADDLIYSANAQLATYYLGEITPGFAHVEPVEVASQCHRAWFVEDNIAAEIFPAVHRWLVENARLVSVNDVAFEGRILLLRVYLFTPEAPTC